MTELLHEWIVGLTAACLVTSCALKILPDGAVKRITQLVCGVVLVLAMLSPVMRMDMDRYALSLARYRSASAELTGSLRETEERLNRLYIEEECEAYILDEARSLGLEGRAEVNAKWRDNCWVPWSADLYIDGSDAGRATLARYMEAQLGIPAERQHWHGEA